MKITIRDNTLWYDFGSHAFTCNCIKDDFLKEIEKGYKDLELNNDMAGGIFQELKDLLKLYPCMHKPNHDENTPPMFYSEWIQCIISKARIQGMEAVLRYEEGEDSIPITKERAQVYWDAYIIPILSQGGVNEVERTS